MLDALARIGAQTIGELHRLPRIRLYRNQGIGQQTVKEIRDLAERVAQHFAARTTRHRLEHWKSPNRTLYRLTLGCSALM